MESQYEEGAVSEDDQQTPAPASWTRRTLLKLGGATGVALMLPEAAFGRTVKPRFGLSNHLHRSSYRGMIGQHFRIEDSPSLKLEHVQDLNSLQAGSETAFALIFSGPAVLENQVPQLYHRWLGSFRLLLSPGPETAHGRTYVAVINQLASARRVVAPRPRHL
jgi:hypothetical protein